MKNVLLIDDDYVTNFINKKMLEMTGLCSSIQIALNGAEALELLKQIILDMKPYPDIIFLDINMPIMGGFSFLEAFNKLPLLNRANTQIAILSSSDDSQDLARAKTLGIKHYLTKPVSDKCLLTILKDVSTGPSYLPSVNDRPGLPHNNSFISGN